MRTGECECPRFSGRWQIHAEQSSRGETVPHPQREDDGDGRVPRVSVMRANARLTVHTVQSMLWGAELGWTTVTANKASVKTILREMASRGPVRDEGDVVAAIWVVDPRSLAEGMRADGDPS